jgi:hypothetical protein
LFKLDGMAGTGEGAAWEKILELARRIDGRALARRPVRPDQAVGLAHAVLAFQEGLDRWKTRSGPDGSQ